MKKALSLTKSELLIYCSVLCCLLVTGCASSLAIYNEIHEREHPSTVKQFEDRLNKYKGSPASTILMNAGAPTQRITVGDEEVWIYECLNPNAQSPTTTTKTTITGNGGLFTPYEAVTETQAEHPLILKMRNERLILKLQFDKKNKLVNWSYTGDPCAVVVPL